MISLETMKVTPTMIANTIINVPMDINFFWCRVLTSTSVRKELIIAILVRSASIMMEDTDAIR